MEFDERGVFAILVMGFYQSAMRKISSAIHLTLGLSCEKEVQSKLELCGVKSRFEPSGSGQ
jgi:hypothetical protein